MSSSQFKCPKCGGPTKEIAAGTYCYKCDILLDATGQEIVSKVEPRASEKPPAPPVGEGAVWTPIVFLGLMILLGWVFGWVLGLVLLLAATLYVHYDAKKYGVESHAWLTLLFAIIGLPLHANELHKLRKAQQTGQVRTLVEPTAKPQPSVNGRQVADVVKPTKVCRECGAKIARDSTYCEECGARLA